MATAEGGAPVDEVCEVHLEAVPSSGALSLGAQHGVSVESPEDVKGRSVADKPRTRRCMELAFRRLNYRVDALGPGGGLFRRRPKVTKHVLQDVSGVFGSRTAGELISIMGQSGAGKTTLLNVLAQRASGRTEGDVFLNGVRNPSHRIIRRLAGYVEQDDFHFAQLTPREYLDFCATMRLPRTVTPEEREARVDDVLHELGLTAVANSQIGHPSEKRGLSGGERKRLSIGAALITDPSILFLDEYTSGLDSETALHVTELLVSMRSRGRLIIATIHQPSSDVFFRFDRLFLVSAGRVAYDGAVSGVVSHFASIGPQFQCPSYYNPAEFVMKSVYCRDGDSALSEAVTSFFPSSPAGAVVEARIREISGDTVTEVVAEEQAAGAAGSADAPPALARKGTSMRLKRQMSESRWREILGIDQAEDITAEKTPGFAQQLGLLMRRAYLLNARNRAVTRLKLIITIVMSLIFGGIYFDLPNDQSGINDTNYLLFYSAIVVGVRTTLESVRVFIEERTVFLREHANGFYGTLPYFLAKSMVDLPFQVLSPLVFSAIVCPMAGLRMADGRFFVFFAALSLICLNATSMGLVLGAGITNEGLLMTVAPAVIFPTLLFSGLSAVNIPPALSWIQWIVYLRYGLGAMVINQFEGRAIECTGPPDACNIKSGDQVVRMYHLEDLSLSLCFGVLIGLIVFTRTCAFFLLRARAKHTTN